MISLGNYAGARVTLPRKPPIDVCDGIGRSIPHGPALSMAGTAHEHAMRCAQGNRHGWSWTQECLRTPGAVCPIMAMVTPPRVLPAVLPIVAIGASAGGLEAASRLFDTLPAAPGMAFIVVQHLEPSHKSLMAGLLGEHTAMVVEEAADGCPLLANHVYVIPPGRYLSVRAGTLYLSAPDARHGARLPFDHLIRSLAGSCGGRTMAVILSGTGADGSGDLAALRASGGFAIAQSPEEAEYPGMPRAAIATGMVDQILALAQMPEALACRAATISTGPQTIPAEPAPEETTPAHPGDLTAILTYLREKTAHDFRQYKPGTIARRITRRMGLLGMPPGDLEAYLDRLRAQPTECDLLASDLLINVTRFFRDPKVFETLETVILPERIGELATGQALRVWAAGCSTGEEAYSIAMICCDAIAAAGRDIKLQIFASDLDPDAIVTARECFYPSDIAGAVTPERLARYFVKEDAGYRVAPALRGHVIFSVQDVLTDPPFSRLDLVACRNLLIYLNVEAQAKVIARFHFALREGGTLVLGTSETIAKADGRFAPIAKAECCYRHIAHSRPGDVGFAFNVDSRSARPSAGQDAPAARQTSLADLCARTVLASHAPAAVLINRQHECLFSMGPTHRYLRVAPGYATLDLLAMATPALRTKLRLAIDRAGKAEPHVDGGHARVTVDGATIRFRIDVQSLVEGNEELLLVCFVEEPGRTDDAGTEAPADCRPADLARITELERELEATQAELQTAIETRQLTNQEHKAINEEALSVNEEFQSANEELLTSKEELQSLNEELTALNSQLQETLERQRLASDDLQNVLYSTNVGTMFLDAELKIRFFTPAIRPLFNVIPGDIGRPLEDLRPIADDPELLADARRVLTHETTMEREILAPGDTWFQRRIFPYRAHDNRIAGVVVTFADITERKRFNEVLEAAKLEAERANAAKSRFLAAASHDLRQPLQALTLLKELLAQIVVGDRAADLLARFDQTLRAVSGMLDVLLNINQIEAGVVTPKPAVFAMSEMLDRLREEFAYTAQARNLGLHILPSSAVVSSDPRLLEQMIRNLLGNAVKYTLTGKILLGCRRHGDAWRIEVWDTGIGIQAHQLHAIFDEFHQVDNPARERSQGLGLGLSIVQRLGHLLGHAVTVRSVPGKGSVFTITVPRGTIAPAAEGAAADAVASSTVMTVATQPFATAPPAGIKIVLVEDDPDLLDLLTQWLRSEGHIVRSASDAATAMAMVMTGAVRPELLLTDYNLPNGDNGIELLATLQDALQETLPAIILTGDISTTALARIAESNAVRLSKPIDPHALMLTIRQICPPLAAHAPLPPVAVSRDASPVIYIIDDEPGILLSLRELLSAYGRTVADFGSAEAFLAAYRPEGAGCLLVDAHLPGLNGVELLAELRARGDHLPVILITGDGDVGLAVEAMQAGACAFIEKPVGRVELLAAIDMAIDQSHDIRAADEAHADAIARIGELTARQREVMDMVLAGHPSKNIAADLGISQRTVENHRAEIMHRMGAKSIPELARTVLASRL